MEQSGNVFITLGSLLRSRWSFAWFRMLILWLLLLNSWCPSVWGISNRPTRLNVCLGADDIDCSSTTMRRWVNDWALVREETLVLVVYDVSIGRASASERIQKWLSSLLFMPCRPWSRSTLRLVGVQDSILLSKLGAWPVNEEIVRCTTAARFWRAWSWSGSIQFLVRPSLLLLDIDPSMNWSATFRGYWPRLGSHLIKHLSLLHYKLFSHFSWLLGLLDMLPRTFSVDAWALNCSHKLTSMSAGRASRLVAPLLLWHSVSICVWPEGVEQLASSVRWYSPCIILHGLAFWSAKLLLFLAVSTFGTASNLSKTKHWHTFRVNVYHTFFFCFARYALYFRKTTLSNIMGVTSFFFICFIKSNFELFILASTVSQNIWSEFFADAHSIQAWIRSTTQDCSCRLRP